MRSQCLQLVAYVAKELSVSPLQVSRCEKFGYGVMMTQVAATAPGVMALHKSGNNLLPYPCVSASETFKCVALYHSFDFVTIAPSLDSLSLHAALCLLLGCRVRPGPDRGAVVRS